MAQSKLITDLVALVTPSNDDVFVIVDNTTTPSLSVTKKITYANLKESLQDMIDVLFSGGTGINASYNDASNTITLSVINDTSTQKSIFSNNGTVIGTRQELNLVPGASITLSGGENAPANRVNFTINSTAVSTASGLPGIGTTYNVLSGVTTLPDGTKRLDLRGIKAGGSGISVGLTDFDQTIVVNVVPSGIDINSLSVGSPLAVALGGTAATTPSGARGQLGAATAGANFDITSLSGLTTALSIGQGGTGGQTAQTALFNIGGLSYVANLGATGESLLVSQKNAVAGEYRTELKSVRAGSAKITVSTVSNSISIDASPNDILNAASANVNLNAFRITNLAAPVADNDAATKGYADSVAQGLTVKGSCRLASTTGFSATYFNGSGTVSAVDVATNTLTINNHGFNTGERVYVSSTGSLPSATPALALNTQYFIINTGTNSVKLATTLANANAGTAIDLTSTGSGVLTVNHTLYLLATANGAASFDGIAAASGDRILLKNQSNATQNGIYAVTELGDVSTPAVLTRADDSNASTDIQEGSFTFIVEGTANGGVAYVQTTQDPVLDASNLVWTVFSSSAIPINTVDNTKLAFMAAGTIKGRQGGAGSGNPQDLTANQVVAIVNTATDSIDCGTY